MQHDGSTLGGGERADGEVGGGVDQRLLLRESLINSILRGGFAGFTLVDGIRNGGGLRTSAGEIKVAIFRHRAGVERLPTLVTAPVLCRCSRGDEILLGRKACREAGDLALTDIGGGGYIGIDDCAVGDLGASYCAVLDLVGRHRAYARGHPAGVRCNQVAKGPCAARIFEYLPINRRAGCGGKRLAAQHDRQPSAAVQLHTLIVDRHTKGVGHGEKLLLGIGFVVGVIPHFDPGIAGAEYGGIIKTAKFDLHIEHAVLQRNGSEEIGGSLCRAAVVVEIYLDIYRTCQRLSGCVYKTAAVADIERACAVGCRGKQEQKQQRNQGKCSGRRSPPVILSSSHCFVVIKHSTPNTVKMLFGTAGRNFKVFN